MTLNTRSIIIATSRVISTLSRRIIAHVKYQSELQRCIIVYVKCASRNDSNLNYTLHAASMIHTILYLTLNYYEFNFVQCNYCDVADWI